MALSESTVVSDARTALAWITDKLGDKAKVSHTVLYLPSPKVHSFNQLHLKSHEEAAKQWKLRLFLIFFLFDGRSRIRIRTNKLLIRIRIQEVQKNMGPDPEQ